MRYFAAVCIVVSLLYWASSRSRRERRRRGGVRAPHDVGDVELIRTVLMPKISMNTVWTTAFPVTVTLEPPWVVWVGDGLPITPRCTAFLVTAQSEELSDLK